VASGLLRASAVMASGTVVSRVLGLAKMMLLAYAIGSVGSRSADAFSIGMELANWVYFLLLGGMLNAVLVPQIVRAAKDKDGGAGYINKLFTLVAVALFGITVIAVVAAPFIVFINQMQWSSEQLALATAFAYWCMPQILFYGLYVVMGEVLNARSVFGPYTWAPVVNNVVGIAGLVAFIVVFGADPDGLRTEIDWTGASIAVLAGSATLGVAVQAIILYIPWRRAGLKYRPDFKWRGMGLGRTVRIASWSFAALIIAQLATLVNNNVIGLGTGAGPANSALQNAAMVFMVPHSVIAVSLATAYFTRLSHAGQGGRMQEFRADFSASIRNIATVMVLAAAVLFTTAPYISRVMNFAASDELVEQFWPPLQAYLVSLVAFSCLFVTQRAFYALSDTRTPFFIVLASQSLMVALALSLPIVFGVPDRLIGLGFASVWSIAQIFAALLAIVLLRRKVGAIDGKRILASLTRAALAVTPALLIGLGLLVWLRRVIVNADVGEAILLSMLIGGVVTGVYLGVLMALRSPELSTLAARLKRRK
jgi:putative peptidoglycan lipid II flippase